MPGKVINLRVKEGQHVKKGDPLVVLSAMKMETNVSAPVAGIVTSISVKKNMQLAGGDLVCTITP